jgi:hypothetical protein
LLTIIKADLFEEVHSSDILFQFFFMYTRDRNVWGGWFLAGNQINHQNFENSLLTNNHWRVFVTIKQNIFFFFIFFKFQNGRLKKSAFFKIANSQKKFVKISGIGPWVSRIDWCEGHWCGSNYMVVRLSDKSSKTGKKCIFGVFRHFLIHAWTLNFFGQMTSFEVLLKCHSLTLSKKCLRLRPALSMCLNIWEDKLSQESPHRISEILFVYGSYEFLKAKLESPHF